MYSISQKHLKKAIPLVHVLLKSSYRSLYVSQGTDIMCLKKNKRGNGHVYLISKAKHVMALDQSFSAKEVCILLAINERTCMHNNKKGGNKWSEPRWIEKTCLLLQAWAR